MATYDEVKGHVLRVLRDQKLFEQDPETLLDKDLVENSLIDSLTMTQMRALVEEEFKVKIDEKLLIEKIHTINDLIKYIADKTA